MTDNRKHARVMFLVHCTSVGHKFPIHQVWNWYIETLLRQLLKKIIWKKEFTPKQEGYEALDHSHENGLCKT